MKKRVLLLIGVIVVAVLAIFACACFAPSSSASAMTIDIDNDGVINPNLLFNSRLDFGTRGFRLLGFTYSLDLGDPYFYFRSDNSSRRLVYYLNDYLVAGETYTFTYYIYNPSVSFGSYLWDYTSAGTISNTFRTIAVNSDFALYTFTFVCPSEPFNIAWISNGAESQYFALGWFKMEVGSSFTGYCSSDLDYQYASSRPNGDVDFMIFNDYRYEPYSSLVFTNGVATNETDFEVTALNYDSISFVENSGLICRVNNSSVLNFGRHNWTYGINNAYITFGFLILGSPCVFSCTLDGVVYSSVCYNGLNIVTFYNENGFDNFSTWSFTFPYHSSSYSSFVLRNFKMETGQYFTNFPTLSGSEISVYNSGYDYGLEAGRQSGFEDGFTQGEESGYDSGYDVGYVDGDGAGYSRGLETARNGNWWQVMTALVNVPVKAIIGFFDIEILGFNVLNLFRTIILISLFIFVVNLLLKKLL